MDKRPKRIKIREAVRLRRLNGGSDRGRPPGGEPGWRPTGCWRKPL
jgi:hypothetical protein